GSGLPAENRAPTLRQVDWNEGLIVCRLLSRCEPFALRNVCEIFFCLGINLDATHLWTSTALRVAVTQSPSLARLSDIGTISSSHFSPAFVSRARMRSCAPVVRTMPTGNR